MPIWRLPGSSAAALEPKGGSEGAVRVRGHDDRHRWSNLSVDRQQDVIGRTKQDSVELPDDVKPDSSHVSRTVVEKDGEEQDVFLPEPDHQIHG